MDSSFNIDIKVRENPHCGAVGDPIKTYKRKENH